MFYVGSVFTYEARAEAEADTHYTHVCSYVNVFVIVCDTCELEN